MDLFTHITVSVAIAYFLFPDDNRQRAFIIGGIAPDLDVLISWIPILSPELYVLQHRGLTHTIFFAPITAIIFIFLTQYVEKLTSKESFHKIITPLNRQTSFSAFFGANLHLSLDLITYSGVPLLYPITSTRYSIGILTVFDPLITVLSAVLVFWVVIRQIKPNESFSFSKFVNYSQVTAGLFLILIFIYSSLFVYTIATQSPTTSSAEFIPIFRWILIEEEDQIHVHLVNQLFQDKVETYSYQKMSFNRTLWNDMTINSVMDEAKRTTDYKAFAFDLEPATRLVYEVKFNDEDGNWEVRITNTLRDAQRRSYGFLGSFFDHELIITVNG